MLLSYKSTKEQPNSKNFTLQNFQLTLQYANLNSQIILIDAEYDPRTRTPFIVHLTPLLQQTLINARHFTLLQKTWNIKFENKRPLEMDFTNHTLFFFYFHPTTNLRNDMIKL